MNKRQNLYIPKKKEERGNTAGVTLCPPSACLLTRILSTNLASEAPELTSPGDYNTWAACTVCSDSP